MNVLNKIKRRVNPFLIITLSFLILIFISSFILYSPISVNSNIDVSYLDSLFMAFSSTCVTGLVSIKESVKDTYTLFGKIYILILIQIGGLGVTTIATMFFLAMRKNIDIHHLNLIKENYNLVSLKSVRKIFVFILIFTFSIELIGAFLLFFSLYFNYNYSFLDSLFYSLFHSVTAFNNAGLDLFGSSSLTSFSNDYYFMSVIMILIILGGLGYYVIIETFAKKFNFKKLTLHSKIVLTFSLVLIILGAIILKISEINNSSFSIFDALFMSVSSRTGGISIVSLKSLKAFSLLILICFGFIGASSGSCGGGVKTTTFFVFLVYLRSIITNKNCEAFKRNISSDLIKKSMLIILLGFLVFLLGFSFILFFEGENVYLLNGERFDFYIEGAIRYSSIDYMLETIGAFSNGLSTGFTPYFKDSSKIVLMCLMFIGRVGPLSISIMFKPKKEKLYRFANEDISIG